MILLSVNGRPVSVPGGVTVAAAIWIAGETAFRHSVSGEPRAPVCGMGVCLECRVTVNGQAHRLSCQLAAEEGMIVQTT